LACDAAGEPSDVYARLWEISENLHRADLTALERAEQIAEWVKLTGEKLGQVAPVSAKGGRGNEGGVRAAVRDLGIERTEARRAVKLAGLSEEAPATTLHLMPSGGPSGRPKPA
jgi:hypothetical protein